MRRSCRRRQFLAEPNLRFRDRFPAAVRLRVSFRQTCVTTVGDPISSGNRWRGFDAWMCGLYIETPGDLGFADAGTVELPDLAGLFSNSTGAPAQSADDTSQNPVPTGFRSPLSSSSTPVLLEST